MSPGSHIAGGFSTSEIKSSKSISLAPTCKYLLAYQQAFLHEETSYLTLLDDVTLYVSALLVGSVSGLCIK